jgi:dATP pyrophosphohydrolase
MSANDSIKIKPSIVIVHVIRINNGAAECLLLRRCSTLKGNWQMVAGKIEHGEKVVDAAKRELLEETGLIADKLYSADFIETYFDARHDSIFMAPVFLALIEKTQQVVLSPKEHDEYKWLSLPEALNYLDFSGQRMALKHIDEYFVKRKPSEHLLIL